MDNREITIATRTVEIERRAVEQGQVIALHNGKLVCRRRHPVKPAWLLLEKARPTIVKRITLFYGANIAQEEPHRRYCPQNYPEQEIENQEGGQPHYQFIISIE